MIWLNLKKISYFEVSMSQSWRNLESIKNLLFLFLSKGFVHFSPKLIWTFWDHIEVINNVFENSSLIMRVKISQIHFLNSLLDSKPKFIITNFIDFERNNQGEDFFNFPLIDG